MLDFNLFMYSFIYLYLFIWLLFGKYASLVLRKIKKNIKSLYKLLKMYRRSRKPMIFFFVIFMTTQYPHVLQITR